MKKAIIAIFAIALAPLAFAITESQKNAFVDKLDNVFVPAQKANDALGADKIEWGAFVEKMYTESKLESVVKPVAEWVISNPLEAYPFFKKDSTARITLVRYYIVSKGLLDWETCTEEQSAVIFGHSKKFDMAKEDGAKYVALKEDGFVSGGIKMSDSKIANLAKNYGDIEVYESLYDKQGLASRFGEYISVLAEAAAVAPSKKAAYEKYASVEASFESMKSVPEVSKNWAKLIGALDAAWIRYERAVKTGSEK